MKSSGLLRLAFSLSVAALAAGCSGSSASPGPQPAPTVTASPVTTPTASPVATPSAAATTLSLSAMTLSGGEQNVIPPGTANLEDTPDLHMPFLRRPDGTYALWASAGGNLGTYLFRTPDFLTLGSPATVFLPAGPGTTAFDADYAGPGSIFPAADGTDLLMIYHAENHLFGNVDYPGSPFYAGIGLARSQDGGVTWQRQGEILSAHDPQQASQPATGAGALNPTAIETGGFIYAIFREVDLQSGVSGYAIARAPVASDGAPGSWQKYAGGSFGSPGLGGTFTPLSIVLDPNAPSDQRQPALSFNTYLGQYLMAMVGNGGIYVLTSRDLLNWSPGLVTLPAPYPDSTITNAQVRNWYPSVITPGEPSDEITGQTGFLYYAKFAGDGTSHHAMYRQAFTLSGVPAEAAPAGSRGRAAAVAPEP